MDTHIPVFDNAKQGILRTKVENGEGTIPIDEDANVPTFDGVSFGERLRTMSCSDKIMKWNVIGLQGGLLSQFIEPVYMSSLTLGGLYHQGHLTRATCCRSAKWIAETQVQLPPGFKCNHPKVAKTSGADPTRETGKMKTKEFSLNWSYGDTDAEVLDGTTGKRLSQYSRLGFNEASRVSKYAIYGDFMQLKGSRTSSSYADTKKRAEKYQEAKKALKTAFIKSGAGAWMSKPVEVNYF